jgi:hypothetical protein
MDTTMDTTSAVMTGVGFLTESLKNQYALTEIEGGAVVYAFTGFPMHYACSQCFAKESIQVLQYRRIGSGAFACLGCKTSFPFKQAKKKIFFGNM